MFLRAAALDALAVLVALNPVLRKDRVGALDRVNALDCAKIVNVEYRFSVGFLRDDFAGHLHTYRVKMKGDPKTPRQIKL